MKSNGNDFKAVEFMRSERKRLTEKYQHDRNAFLKGLDRATQDFLKQRKKKRPHTAAA